MVVWEEMPKIPCRRVSGPTEASDYRGPGATRQLYSLALSEDKI